MTHESVCGTCGKNFRSQRKDSTTCYGCALTRLIGNGAPEEGDFNSALLISGEMSDEDARQLQEDLESVDHSGAEAAWSRMVEEYNDEYDDRYDDLDERDDDE
jgi:hypothetical protein